MLGKTVCALLLSFGAVVVFGCGDDDDGPPGTPAQRLGVGAACNADIDCAATAPKCLPFKGGYCGLADCTNDAGCPAGSACVTHDDGKNYCFLVCRDKAECNVHRPLDVESNCSSSTTFVDDTNNLKACIPPS